MSLADQSHQFYPTSVQVTVHQARNLRTKGKNGTNDAYAIIQVAKDKFSTSVDERCIAAVWKEEASFELPLFHPNNAERCRLNVIVMHRAQVGLDKFLGQAVINLLNLQDQKLSKKTDWFPLLDKSGKDDKARGEVLLDIQFLRNNMSASMFDLSMQDKPRSRISKIKDKVRGKKRDGFSDSASAIVPHVSSIVSDSEGEADAQSLNQFPGAKKKSKLQKLFAPKTNLHKNISQSMSTLGSQPSKDSSLSGSRSSGLNVDSPEGKKKFKFLGHKRTGSNDSKASQGPFSQGPFSLLGRHKQSASDVNSVCINGSHVYAEEAEPKTGSTLSLNSSGKGSVEDFHTLNSQYSMDSIKGSSAASSRQEEVLEQSNRQEQEGQEEEEERRQATEKRRAEDLRLAQGEEEERGNQQSEGRRLQELEEQRRYREEQERRQRLLEEEEARRRKKIMDEEERQRGEERRMLQAMDEAKNEEENRREEAQKAEEKKRQDEASMSERLSTLFGISRRKEEKKEEAQPEREEPVAARGLELHASQTSNPFEEISLSPEAQNPFEEAPPPKTVRSPQTLSAGVFLNRTAKVSAVKPRPHPVKPMSSAENQFPSSSPAVKDIRILDTKAAHIKAEVLAEGAGAYTQLTQEELITLVVKQQLELTKRKNKIAELEEYIDNLLVRVIDEKPSILLGISSSKPA
ncbi:rab11 family-interacting protein 1 isoform X1 [Gadus macrocephalus]|uniref:rab11 family-interacting protein 1 isoform X1 n=1 Tax=Gadus macrocephalus TaxID=80720 RepID=UPI0028CBA477|nr:rab11 family-interacting protein 1 isoform X1 [Gadus macrocephalus]